MGADDDVEGYSPNRTVTRERVLEGSTTPSAGVATVCQSPATLTIAFEMERGDFSLDCSASLSDGLVVSSSAGNVSAESQCAMCF